MGIETRFDIHECINEFKEQNVEVSRQSLCGLVFYKHLPIVFIVISKTQIIMDSFVVSIHKPHLLLHVVPS